MLISKLSEFASSPTWAFVQCCIGSSLVSYKRRRVGRSGGTQCGAWLAQFPSARPRDSVVLVSASTHGPAEDLACEYSGGLCSNHDQNQTARPILSKGSASTVDLKRRLIHVESLQLRLVSGGN